MTNRQDGTLACAHARLKTMIRTPPTVAVVRLCGTIGMGRREALTLQALEKPLRAAFTTRQLRAVALVVNSPGDAPAQAALIADRIRMLAQIEKVPVLAFCEDAATSGGYWLACAADEIYVQPASLIGSIGVISAGFGFQDLRVLREDS